jgi:hypothetical protein|tara:strand:+ start:763 stop:1989 length:1227 start_codon:yes stop_codon:yes gene_type:complete
MGARSSKTANVFGNIDAIEFEKNDIALIKKQLRQMIEVHKKRRDVFVKLKNSKPTETDFRSRLTQTELQPDSLKPSSTEIAYLHDIGAIYFEKSGVSRVLKADTNFENVYRLFIENMSHLQNINIGNPDMNTAGMGRDEDDQISRLRQGDDVGLNVVLVRILFYSYSIIFNQYLTYIYVMYSKKQFTVIDKTFRRLQREHNLRFIRNTLDMTSKKAQTVLSSSGKKSEEFTKSINDMGKSFNERLVNEKQSGGMPPSLVNLLKIHDAKADEYMQSNKTFTAFLTMVNSIIKDKTDKKLAAYNSQTSSSSDDILTDKMKSDISEVVNSINNINNYDKGVFETNSYENVDINIANYVKEHSGASDAATAAQLTKFKAIITDLVEFRAVQANMSSMRTQLPTTTNSQQSYL